MKGSEGNWKSSIIRGKHYLDQCRESGGHRAAPLGKYGVAAASSTGRCRHIMTERVGGRVGKLL